MRAAERASRPRPLLKYLLVAAVIVVGSVAIVAGYANREQLAIKIKSVYAPVTPKPVTPFSARLYQYKTPDGGSGLALLSGSKNAYDLRIYFMAKTQANSQ